jgi:hypothetical protein
VDQSLTAARPRPPCAGAAVPDTRPSRSLDGARGPDDTSSRIPSESVGNMGRVEPAEERATRTHRPSPLLTSRRHIDLLRVCSAASPLR